MWLPLQGLFGKHDKDSKSKGWKKSYLFDTLFYDKQAVTTRLPSVLEVRIRCCSPGALTWCQLIVAHRHGSLVSHPIVNKLLEEKWSGYARFICDSYRRSSLFC